METDSEIGEATRAIDSGEVAYGENADLEEKYGQAATRPKEYIASQYHRSRSSPEASVIRLEQSSNDNTRIHSKYTDQDIIGNEHELNNTTENTDQAAENGKQNVRNAVPRCTNESSTLEYDGRWTRNLTLNSPGMRTFTAVVRESFVRPASVRGKVKLTLEKQDAVTTRSIPYAHAGKLSGKDKASVNSQSNQQRPIRAAKYPNKKCGYTKCIEKKHFNRPEIKTTRNIVSKSASHTTLFNRRFFETFSKRSTDDICQGFTKHKEEFIKLMGRCSKDGKMITMLLDILAKIASSNSDTVITLISVLHESHFIEKNVVPYLLSLVGRACENIETVLNALRLATCIASSSIRSIVSFYSILTALTELVAELKASEVLSDQIQSDIEEFDQLRTRLLSIKRTTDNTKGTKEDLSKPPNDFRTINVVPTSADLITTKPPFMRKNKAFGSFIDLDHYLDVQFRLLREDYIAPFRESIREYKASPNINRNGKTRVGDIRVYYGVKLAGTTINASGIGHILKFDTSTTKRVKWECSQRLIYGSLLCLSHDDFNASVFAVVTNRTAKDLAQGIVEVKFYCDTENIQILFSKVFVMAESDTYFEAYRHNLIALQKIEVLPFSRYIVSCTETIAPPAYLAKNTNIIYDMRPLVIDNICFESGEIITKNEYQIPILVDEKWPKASTLKLDESQYRAVKNALTNEFSITQGPPGTGKTFVGLKIAKSLLLNKSCWTDVGIQPMLIVCYTNHALDQFLCEICKFFKGRIVRVGGRSSNKVMQEHGLHTMYKYVSYDVKEESKTIGKIKDQTKSQITVLKEKLLMANKTILSEKQLQTCMGKNLYHSLVFGFEVIVFHMNRLRKRDDQLFPGYFNVMEEWLGNGKLIKDCEFQVLFQTEDSTDLGKQQETSDDSRDLFDLVGCTPKHETIHVQQPSVRDILKGKGQGAQVKTKAPEQSNDGAVHFMNIIPAENKDIMSITDVWNLQYLQRWQLYKRWIEKYKVDLKMKLKYCEEDFEMVCQEFTEIREEKQRQALCHADVIGMTTTCAAKYFNVLQRVRPKIVIVEEAAEVLEAHIVTSLSEHCEHLILIGDHKQLKPSPAVYKLAVKYNLDVSLFERMINNKVKFECLEFQHRMRPEISKLIRLFYPNLKDNQSVIDRPNIRGVASNVFFVSHPHPEQHDEENTSHSNMFEAEFLVALCRYLLKQTYRPSEITVLTTYSAQMFLLKQMMSDNREFQGVTITVVDNYQGEENNIILLSLVRSNSDENIGFLKIENRVNVALSRARNGLYVVGNFETMSKVSEIWSKIKTLLETNNQFGPAIPLFCRNHPQNQLFAATAQDFQKAPEGGCSENCDTRLNCGHACRLKCHVYDTEHVIYKCMADCNKRCQNDHRCMDRCFEKCRDCCVPMNKKIPKCNHLQLVPCHMDPNKFKCQVDCEEILSCGHECTSKCHQEKHECFVIVTIAFELCDHVEKIECCRRPIVNQCGQPCQFILPCRHKCVEKCGEPHTSLCKEEVLSDLECGHSVTAPCHKTAESLRCPEPCEVKLSCGHYCKKACGELPHTNVCEETVKKKLKCGHTMPLFCSDNPNDMKCLNACMKKLSCGHFCGSRCFDCENGNFHKPCASCGLPDKEHHTPYTGLWNGFPCVAPCTNQCSHTKCNKFCFEPCADDGSIQWICQKKCGWACEHKQCSKLCSEVCDRETCKLPCEKLVAKGLYQKQSEKCQGYCGETCGYEERPGFGFRRLSDSKPKIFLKTCNHAVEVCNFEMSLMDKWSNCGPTCRRCRASVLIDDKMLGNTVRKYHEVKERRKLESEFYERHRELKGVFTVLEVQLNMISRLGERESLRTEIQNRRRSFDDFLHFQRQGYEDLKRELERLQIKCAKFIHIKEKEDVKKHEVEENSHERK